MFSFEQAFGLYPPGVLWASVELSSDTLGDIAMSGADITVLALSVLAIAGLGWYFFAPRKGHMTELGDGVQKIAVTVRGECTNRVVFADLGVSAGLPAHTKTIVRLRPDRPGTFGFACGMNMVHGTLVVDPAEHTSSPTTATEPITARLDARAGGASA